MPFSINDNSILLVDLDNTLVFTDTANNLAYIEAIQCYYPNFQFDFSYRITRGNLFYLLKSYSGYENVMHSIIERKEVFYEKYLSTIELNGYIYNILKEHDPNRCFIITNAGLRRVISIIDYFGLNDFFRYIFSIRRDKYKILFGFNFFYENKDKVFVFENDENEICFLNNILSSEQIFIF
ncbi:hypothetical protein ACLSY8_04635 [Avibacterium avium]|uniref:hypothetical protein n=2 Tax=Avibacterium avium TaxID=751 RepID=UPI003BF8B5E3